MEESNNNELVEQIQIMEEDVVVEEQNSKNVVVEQPHLPEHIITQHILPWLPIKPLTKFKLVSKDWYSLISSSNFIDKHFKLSLFFNNPNYSPIQSLFIQSWKKFYLCNLKNVIELDVNLMIGSHSIVLVGCCNGLICLAEPYGKFFILWNPAIKMLHKFFPPDFELLLNCDNKHFCAWGFGYVSSVDDYKTVRTIWRSNGENASVHVHSFKLNKWRKIESGFELCPMPLIGRPKLVNETVYWRTAPCRSIVGFDLQSEGFHLFRHLSLSSACDSLCVLGGCLGICETNSNNDLRITIYKGFGKVASVRVLSDTYVCKFPNLIGFSKTGMIYLEQHNPPRLEYIAGPTLKKTLFEFPNCDKIRMESYVPTQVSPVPPGEESNAFELVPQEPFDPEEEEDSESDSDSDSE